MPMDVQLVSPEKIAYSGEAVMVLCRWSVEEAGFHRMGLEHSIGNPASSRVAVKAGFREEGYAQKYLCIDGFCTSGEINWTQLNPGKNHHPRTHANPHSARKSTS